MIRRTIKNGTHRRQNSGTSVFWWLCTGWCLVWSWVVYLPEQLLAKEDSLQSQPRTRETLRLAVDDDPHSLDPTQLWSNHAAALSFLIFNSLIEEHPGAGFVPALAAALPTISPDARTFRFRLRPGIRFSNGRELVAEDVVYSFERGCDPSLGWSVAPFFRNILGSPEFGAARAQDAEQSVSPEFSKRQRRSPQSVAGLRALDRYTFQLQLLHPDLTAMMFMASIGIVPREEVLRTDRPFGTFPIGTGAFRLKHWSRGTEMEFERNPTGFSTGPVRLDAVEVMLNVDQTTQAMMIDRGEINFQFYCGDTDVRRWRADPLFRTNLVTFKGAAPNFVALNCELPPYTNRLVRRALNHAVNKEVIVRKLLNRGVPAYGPLPANAKGYNPKVRGYAYDPEKARALLREAGFPNGFTTTLWVLQVDPTQVKLGLSIQEDLRAVGVTAEIRLVSWPTLLESMSRRRTVPMGLMNAPASTEPKDFLDFLLNGENIAEEGSLNMAFYSNMAVQTLLREAATAAEETARIHLYQQIEQRIIEDAPWIFLCHADMDMVRQPWLRGARCAPLWPPVRFECAWIER